MNASRLQITVACVLLAGIVASGLGLVVTMHESRRLFQELEALRSEQDRLQDDWSALSIEVGQLAGHARIDRIAREEMGFIDPVLQRLYAENAR